MGKSTIHAQDQHVDRLMDGVNRDVIHSAVTIPIPREHRFGHMALVQLHVEIVIRALGRVLIKIKTIDLLRPVLLRMEQWEIPAVHVKTKPPMNNQ